MKNILLIGLCISLIGGCSSSKQVKTQEESSFWRKDSAKLFRIFGKTFSSYNPENANLFVSEKYEPFSTPYSKTFEKNKYAVVYRFKKKLEKYIIDQKDPELRLDAKLLQGFMDFEMLEIETHRELGVVPFVASTQFILKNLSALIKEGEPQKRINNGMARFRSYVRGNDKQMPFILGFMAHVSNRMEQLEEKRMRGFWPTQAEIKTYIETSSANIQKIEKILSIWKSDDWRRDLETLKEQDKDYQNFLIKKVLPYARKNHVLPTKIYALNLRAMGIETNPSELIDVAKEDYKKTLAEFKKQAVIVARQKKLSTVSPADIINIFRGARIRNMDELVRYHHDTFARMIDIVKKNNLLTLEEIPPYIIRPASNSEASSSGTFILRYIPFSRKTITPQIVVVPGDPQDNSFDASHKEIVVNFTARQGIPGSLLRYFYYDALNPTDIRTVYSVINHNVEGWSLLAEDMVYPFLTEEEKLVFLQRKLFRQARMFLDAEYNLGRISIEKVKDIYIHELGFSQRTADNEAQLMKNIPGAAPTSYHGYLLIKKIKDQFVKGSVTEKCFNDYVVRAGILPYDELTSRLKDSLYCGDLR